MKKQEKTENKEVKFCPKCGSEDIVVTGGETPQDTCRTCGYNDWKNQRLNGMQFPNKSKKLKNKT